MYKGVYKGLQRPSHIPNIMTDKKQITVRVNEKLLKLLRKKYFFIENNDSEIMRQAMIEALRGGVDEYAKGLKKVNICEPDKPMYSQYEY